MRKLAIFAASFSAAIFISNYILRAELSLAAALICLAIGIFCLIKKAKKQAIICLLALTLGFGWFFVHCERTSVPAKELDGYTGQFTATVTGYPTEGDIYSSIELSIDADNAPPIKARIYDYTGSFSELRPGQRVSMTAKLRSADTRYGENDPYYNSRDIYILGTYKSDLEIIKDSGFYLPGLPAYIGKAVSQKIDEIFPAETTAFMKALLIGDRGDFYDDIALTTDFSLSGFMHVVAVSGMHISFLIGFIVLVLGKSPRSSVISIAVIWLFAFASGASPSVIRASFMQTVLVLAPVFRREDDPITTLSFALMVILMFNPFSAASLSLQLSFAAVAGIVLFSDKIQDALFSLFKIKNPYSAAAYPLGIIASSVSVLILSTPFVALYFGYVQILSIITNILGLWAVSFCFCVGQIACALGFIVPKLGAMVSWLCVLPVRHIFGLVKLVSDIPFSVIYLNDTLMLIWLAIVYAVFTLFLLAVLPTWKKLAIPTVISLMSLILILCGVKLWYNQSGGFVTVLDVGQGQCITAFSKDKTVMIDCGGKSVSENPGKTAGAFIRSSGRDKIDILIITHAHDDHANGVLQLLELVDIETIIMPEPSEESTLYTAIVESAENHGTAVEIVNTDDVRQLGSFTLTMYAPEPGGKDNNDCLISIISIGDYDVLVTGDSPAKLERMLLREHVLPDIETFIVGHHGSKYSNTEELISAINGENAIISVGFNSYGHPTEEVIDRLTEYGYNIYRTDENGNIQIWVDLIWPGKTIKTKIN